jgi:nucleoside-diphosphate-sugar epimerase
MTAVEPVPAASHRLALVTGATGFIGGHIAEALLAAGWKVRCASRPTSDRRWIEQLPVELVTLDLSAGQELGPVLHGVRAVVHVAGITNAIRESRYMEVNAAGTEAIARAAVEATVSRFVLVSSLAARGPDSQLTAGDRPVSAYGRSKLAAERRLAAVVRESEGGLSAVVLRPAGVYGPRDREFLRIFKLARFGWLPLPTGAGPLQLAHVADVAAATVCAVETAGAGFGPFPVAGAEVTAWPEVAVALAAAIQRRVRVLSLPAGLFHVAGALWEAASRVRGKLPELDRRRATDLASHTWTCELDTTLRELGWRPEIRLVEGFGRTVDWYVEHGWLRP